MESIGFLIMELDESTMSRNANRYISVQFVKSVYNDVNYNILEKIKDGKAISTKYKGKKMRFKRPNVIMVFLNMYPDTRGFSQDRWLIFKINTKMMLQEVSKQQLKKEEKVNDVKKYNMDWKKETVYDRMVRY